jgi:hypothetical protein
MRYTGQPVRRACPRVPFGPNERAWASGAQVARGARARDPIDNPVTACRVFGGAVRADVAAWCDGRLVDAAGLSRLPDRCQLRQVFTMRAS